MTAQHGLLRGRIAALLAAALGAAAVAVLPIAAEPAEAALPAECGSAGVACLQLYVGDDRAGGFGIDPLPGATFGLFLDLPPTANPDPPPAGTSGFTVPGAGGNPPVYFTCVSQADGTCVLVVPIRPGPAVVGADQTAPYANNAALDRGVPERTRLWALPLLGPPCDPGAPTDPAAPCYYANPFWETADLVPGTTRADLRHTFQTPPLVGGQTYLNGIDWIRDPGLQTTPTTTVPTNNYPRRAASAGRWPLGRFNIPMPQQCGIDVAFVVDVSSSIVSPVDYRGQLVDAMDAFVDALQGTPSRVALYTFGSDSPAPGFATESNSALMPVGTPAEATTFKNRYGYWVTKTWPTNFTNWDRGFAAVAESNPDASDPDHFELVVLLTDGNPTVYGPSPTQLGNPNALKDANSGYTRFRELGDGLASSNSVKGQGTRVLAVGVGAGVAGPGAAENLRTISGRFAYDGTNILTADYVQTDDFAGAGEAMRNVVFESCAPTISITKRLIPNGQAPEFDAQGDVTNALIPTTPWSIALTATTANATDVTVSPSNGGAAGTNAAAGTTVEDTGTLSFALDIQDADQQPIAVSFAEAGQAGYTPLPDLTECTNKFDGANYTNGSYPGSGHPNVDGLDTATGGAAGDGMTVSSHAPWVGMDTTSVVTCVIYNEAPAAVEPASVFVEKHWVVRVSTPSGIVDFEYANGEQPAGMSAQLQLSGPDSATPTDQPWEQERTGYNAVGAAPASEVHIQEAVSYPWADRPGCAPIGDPDIVQLAFDAGSGTWQPVPPTLADLPPGGTTFPVAAGVNAWRIVNVVGCVSTLTLVKELQHPLEGVTDDMWTQSSPAVVDTFPSPEIAADYPGPNGATGTAAATAEVFPQATYALAELRPGEPSGPWPPADSPEHYTYHYAQPDDRTTERPPSPDDPSIRTTGLLYPASTGSWDCHPLGDQSGDPSIGVEGAVVVPFGMDYECIAVNRTATLSVEKTVLEGGADPDSFAFVAQWLPPLTVPDSQAVPHVFASGEEQSLVPGQRYRVLEQDPGDYSLASMTCESGGVPVEGVLEDFTLLAGMQVECAATNALTPILPPTGRAPGATALIAFAALATGALALLFTARLRRR